MRVDIAQLADFGLQLDAPLRARYSAIVRVLLNIVVALALGWSSVVDNPALCPDDISGPISSSRPCNDDDAPAVPCVSCPCHLPSLRMSAEPSVEPQLGMEAPAGSWPEQHIHLTEPVPPPTPPPLARVTV